MSVIKNTDVLIVGSGIAGLSTALMLSENIQVTLITKGKNNDCSTAWAQGGMASVLSETDSFKKHIQDTVKNGKGIVSENIAAEIIKNGPSCINWLIKNIPIDKKIFLEIGTENYKESNTRFLLMKNNWTGHIVEANKNFTKNIKKQSIYWKYDLNVHNSLVTKENINKILKELNLKKIGLFSLDIDGVDYWIWKEIKEIKPIIFVCEFNSVFGNKKKITVPYKKNFSRTKYHYSNLAFGASINDFIEISKKKEYNF